MIDATITQLPGTQTPEGECLWQASCRWNGLAFSAQSRSGASYELCRVLVAAGCPDEPMAVLNQHGRLMLTIPSIHKAAGLTIEESAKRPIHTVRYKPMPDGVFRAAEDPKTGGDAS